MTTLDSAEHVMGSGKGKGRHNGNDGYNTDEAVDFSQRWYGADTRTIITIHPETGITQRGDFEPQDEAAMRACIEAAQGWLNVYFVANACKPGETSPTKDEMTGGHCLHLDADFKDFDCSAEELLAVIRLFTPPPSVIVFTGGGYQAVWIYDGTFVDKDWARRIEASNAAVARVIGAAPGCQNVNRLLRLPGTVNVLSATKRKAGRQPAPAYLVDADWELKWSYEHPVPRLPEGSRLIGRRGSFGQPHPIGKTRATWTKAGHATSPVAPKPCGSGTE